MDTGAGSSSDRSWNPLDLIEWVGNKLPDPITLFFLGALLVLALSQVGAWLDWSVQPMRPRPVLVQAIDDATGQPLVDAETGDVVMTPQLDGTGEAVVEWEAWGEPIEARGLLDREGFFWAIANMVPNFIGFAPLGVVLTGMLGIGVAERSGLIAALLKGFMRFVPSTMLTPAMVFIGVMSSMAMDAGYVVLPPLAAALYKAAGRSPLAGIAAVFAGVAAGFNANLLITGLDPMLSGLSTEGARVIDADYVVTPQCNWWFMIASTFVLTLTGWGVTSWFVERRLRDKSPEDGGPSPVSAEELAAQDLTSAEFRGLMAALGALVIVYLIVGVLVAMPWGAFHGPGVRFARWIEVIVPLIFISFAVPGLAFGIAAGSIRSDKDAAKMMIDAMAAMGPIIVLAFFAGQFIAYFNHSNLGAMLAETGGYALGRADLPPWALMMAFIAVTMTFNLLIGSMSAKYTLFAPIFVPMFMLVGIAPELTQAAYRIGDSVTNIITPLNAYLVIILVFMQKYAPRSGMGTLIATMLPYSIAFVIVWTIMLVVWMWLGIPLGPAGPLWYEPV